MRRRLQADLRAAIKGRMVVEVAVLRTLIAAIDNAGAVPLAPPSEPRQGEVERRRLSGEDVQRILRRERTTRQEAAEEFARLGLQANAESASREAAVVSRYLRAEPGGGLSPAG